MNKSTQNRWSERELKTLQMLRNKDYDYNDVSNIIKTKNIQEVKSKCECMRITRDFKGLNEWKKKDLELLKSLYPITPNDELPNYFNGKSKGAICTQANRMSLKKDYNHRELLKQNQSKWNTDKNIELISIFNNEGEGRCYDYFKSKYGHRKTYIQKKLVDNKLLNKYNISSNDNPNLVDAFYVYKLILKGEIKDFNQVKCNLTKNQIIMLFKYYIKIKNINVTREYLLNIVYGELLKESGLKNIIKNKFDGYYDFIISSYPRYSLKNWEFKHLDVQEGFWGNKYNRFWCIREGLEKLKKEKLVYYNEEALELEYNTLGKYMSSSLMYYYNKNCIREYFDFIKSVNYKNTKIYNNIRFDSYQEKQVYKFIFENVTENVDKCNKRDGFYFFNDKYKENYIPDFYINIGNNILIIEYFGMYNPNNPNIIFKKYCDKTKRKIEYFNSLEDAYFIPLFPEDLNNSFKGVRDKLTSFLMQKNITLKGGVVNEKQIISI